MERAALQVPEERSRWGGLLAEKLVVPVAVTVLGAVFTALAVPALTQRWQAGQEALAVRTDLADSISAASASAIVSARMVVRGQVYAPTADPGARTFAAQEEFNRGYREWTVESARIATLLSARVRGSGLPADWRAYARAVESYYRLAAVIPDRAEVLEALRAYAPGADVEWGALERERDFKESRSYITAYERLGAILLARADALIARMLGLDPTV